MTSKHEAKSGEGQLASWDSTNLFYRWSRPAVTRGVVIVVHGILEHSGSYGHLERALVARDFGFCAFDHRGHGRSSGPRGDLERFDDLVRDADAFCRHVRDRFDDVPMFLFGHSMGAIVAARAATRSSHMLNGVVLAAAPLGIGLAGTPLARGLARAAAFLFPRLTFDPGLDPDDLTHDPASVEAVKTDPLRLQRLTLRWGVGLLRAIGQLRGHARELTIPVLLLYGEEDPIAGVAGAREFLECVGSADRELIVFPGVRHEIYNEASEAREKVFASLVSWMSRHLDSA